MIEDFKLVLRIKYFDYFFLFFFFYVGKVRRSGHSGCLYGGEATFGMPSGIGSVVSVPFGTGQ